LTVTLAYVDANILQVSRLIWDCHITTLTLRLVGAMLIPTLTVK